MNGEGDDHRLDVLGWATCFQNTRTEVADYLLAQGARLNLWSAIALGRVDDVRGFIAADPALLTSRMSRSEHRRTVLHHAAAKNQTEVMRLLLSLGADVEIARMLLDAGADPQVHDDKYDNTPLGWAEFCEQPQIVKLLRERGVTR